MVDRKLKAAKGAFDASLDNGIDFFDTAEVYGSKVPRKQSDYSSSRFFVLKLIASLILLSLCLL